jgi:hypothetical protein
MLQLRGLNSIHEHKKKKNYNTKQPYVLHKEEGDQPNKVFFQFLA